MKYSRLTEPVVRTGGKLQASTWDAALDAAVAGFRSTIDRLGPSGFGMFSCSKATNEVNYLAQKFTRAVIGSHNIDSCNRTCTVRRLPDPLDDRPPSRFVQHRRADGRVLIALEAR
jgi:predicted molibdopterin-dependent oxidoreductase YjgC